MLTKEELERWDIEELKLQEQILKEVIKRKERANAKEFKFNFEVRTKNIRGKSPYAARLIYRGEIVERMFMDLERTYSKNEVIVTGTYTAKVGDIIEKRIGVNGKEEQRFWYLINNDGSEVKVADFANAKQKQRVISYLKKEISAKELLKDAWVNEVN